MSINDPRHFGFNLDAGSCRECTKEFLTADEEVKLEEFEKDKPLMRYVGLNDEGARLQMEKMDPTLRIHAAEYKRIKAKAEKVSEEKE